MVHLTISLPDHVVKRLRRVIKERFQGKRGALSGLIQEALVEYLNALEAAKASPVFRAMRQDEVVAEGSTLEELASRLKGLGVDPRSVRIVSSAGIRPIARAGLRARPS